MRLLPDTQDFIEVEPHTLIELTRIPLPSANEAQRPISPTHLQSFLQSHPQRWPPVLLTRTDTGFLLLDGYHRREAARRLSLPTITASVQAFATLEEVIETAFQANLVQGLPASQRTRSAYGYWLFVHHPDLPQTEIAKKVGVTPATVNIAIKRRVEQEQRKHRSREQRLQDEKCERQEALTDAVRAYSRAADELYGQLLHLHFHHPEEEKEQALRQALSLYSSLKQTLPPERTHQRPTLRLPPQQEPAKEHLPQDT